MCGDRAFSVFSFSWRRWWLLLESAERPARVAVAPLGLPHLSGLRGRPRPRCGLTTHGTRRYSNTADFGLGPGLDFPRGAGIGPDSPRVGQGASRHRVRDTGAHCGRMLVRHGAVGYSRVQSAQMSVCLALSVVACALSVGSASVLIHVWRAMDASYTVFQSVGKRLPSQCEHIGWCGEH